jgi:hypothetical protein
MPKRLLMDQFHLSVYVPRTIRPAAAAAVRRTLAAAGFRRRLRQAVRAVAGRYPSLRPATFVLSD